MTRIVLCNGRLGSITVPCPTFCFRPPFLPSAPPLGLECLLYTAICCLAIRKYDRLKEEIQITNLPNTDQMAICKFIFLRQTTFCRRPPSSPALHPCVYCTAICCLAIWKYDCSKEEIQITNLSNSDQTARCKFIILRQTTFCLTPFLHCSTV